MGRRFLTVVFVCLASLGAGATALAALRLRGAWGWSFRLGAIAAAATALGVGVAMIVLLPPRGDLRSPTYYAHGPDIPRALRAIESAGSTADVLGEELDAQLVGHTRRADILIDRGLMVLNGGTVGAGGTGNLDETTKIGAARLIYATVDGAVAPLAADLVEIDPGSGSATARRYRLDVAETSQARR